MAAVLQAFITDFKDTTPVGVISILFHLLLVFFVFAAIITLSVYVGNTLRTPKPLTGWSDHDYDADQRNRASLTDYMSANNIPDNTPMVQFSVATANFGGIYTENIGPLSPYIGSVASEAARLQVEAGARAMVLDIWPDPANSRNPVVCSMMDLTEWGAQSSWLSWGLNAGVGRYSNWQLLTRNTDSAIEIAATAVTAAFNSAPGAQNADPFFLILKLHGAMTIDYLNTLGTGFQRAIGGRAMGPEWSKAANQSALCNAPVSAFMGKVFVIVIPDIQSGYNSLPNTNTYAGFTTQFLTTKMGEITNALEQTPNTIMFEPGTIGAISVPNQPNCVTGGGPISLAQAGFVLVQPTVGGQSTDNSALFSENSFTNCLQSGAQFVAVNLFSPTAADGPLMQYFDEAQFGKYSFKKGA